MKGGLDFNQTPLFKQNMKENKQLIEKSLAGDKKSLELLIKEHQNWVYNAAINLTSNTEDAADLMQETLIKMITNLSKFQFKSGFRTWLYSILKNTFLNTLRKKEYHQTIPWKGYAEGLDSIKDQEFDDDNKAEIIEEAKLSCMKGMLLCLTPDQRLVYVLGELFELPDTVGSEVMEITKVNFRKKLSRTREELYGFMNNKCGLINTNNPCRCSRKTTGFIKKGYVDPENLQFQKEVISKINTVVVAKLDVYENNGYREYQKLYQNHNFQEPKDRLASLKKILSSDHIKDTFEL